MNDARFLAIKPYLARGSILEIETPFLPGAPISV